MKTRSDLFPLTKKLTARNIVDAYFFFDYNDTRAIASTLMFKASMEAPLRQQQMQASHFLHRGAPLLL